MRRLLVIAALAATAVPAAAQPDAPGSIGIALLDAPVGRQEDPRAQSSIVDHLGQGGTITRRVEVTSTLPHPMSVTLYGAAASVTGGAFVFGEGRAENELTGWLAVDPPMLSVPPNGAAQATVTIAVPTDAEDGERYGVVWAELPPGTTSEPPDRVGVRIYLSVGEGEEPPTDFTIDALTAGRDAAGTPIVDIHVTNTGGRAIDLTGTLVLGDGAATSDVRRGTTIAPGETAPARVALDGSLADGPWEATVTIASGRRERTASATITFPSAAGATAAPVEPDAPAGDRRQIVARIAAGAALAVVGTGAVHVLRRRGAGPRRPR